MRFLFFKKKRARGTTIVEVMIVIIVIGIIIGAVMKGYELIENSRLNKLVLQIESTKNAIQSYIDRRGKAPITQGEQARKFWEKLAQEKLILLPSTFGKDDDGPASAVGGHITIAYFRAHDVPQPGYWLVVSLRKRATHAPILTPKQAAHLARKFGDGAARSEEFEALKGDSSDLACLKHGDMDAGSFDLSHNSKACIVRIFAFP